MAEDDLDLRRIVTRLPPALRPLWPAAKRIHRASAHEFGRWNRRISDPTNPRSVPHTATTKSTDTVALDPVRAKLHLAHPATTLRRPQPVGQPPEHWFFDALLQYEVPPRFTLELTDGRLVGNYAAHLTAEGVLDYETSDYFDIRSWQEHPIFLRNRLPEPKELDGAVVSLSTRGTTNNYYHAMMDLAARWGVFEESLPGVRPDAVVVNTRTNYQREILARLGIDQHRQIEATKHVSLRAETLYVPCLPNPMTLAPPWITGFLQRRLPPRDTKGLPTRLYITRGTGRNTRRVVEEEDLRAALNRLGFVVFDPGSASVQEQIDHFASARVIVAPHGAGLTNLNFCRPGVRVLELFAPTYLNPGFWAITNNIEHSRYRYLIADRPRAPRPGRAMTGIQHDIHLSPQAVLDALEELLAD